MKACVINFTQAFLFGAALLRFLISVLVSSLMLGAAHADILVGVAGPMSGQYQIFGDQMVHGAQAAIDDINALGGISGQLLRIQIGDDACDVHKAEEVAHGFVAAGVSMVIGHYCSTPALAAAKIYEAAGVIMVVPQASLPSLADGAGWNVLRLASRDDVQADVAALRIGRENPAANVAVLEDGSLAANNLSKRFLAHAAKPPALVQSFKPDAPDFFKLVLDVKAAKIDVVYFACNAGDAGRIAAALQGAGVLVKMFGPDQLLVDEYWVKSAIAAEESRVTFTTDPQSSFAAKPVIAALKIAGFNADGATLPSYAALQLYAAAAVAHGTSAHAIADWLHSGAAINTVLGPLSFDTKGEVQPPRFVWYRWHQGLYGAEPLGK